MRALLLGLYSGFKAFLQCHLLQEAPFGFLDPQCSPLCLVS